MRFDRHSLYGVGKSILPVLSFGVMLYLSGELLATNAQDREEGAYEISGCVFFGDQKRFSHPCTLNLMEVLDALPQCRGLSERDKKIFQYDFLKEQADKIVRSTIRHIAEGKGYDLVVEHGKIYKENGQSIPDISEDVIAALAKGEHTKRPAWLREGPESYYEAIGRIPAGTFLLVGERRGNWFNAETGAMEGWIAAKAFEELEGGFDLSGLADSHRIEVITSIDVSAATRGLDRLFIGQSLNYEQAAKEADKLDAIRVDPADVLEIKRSLSPSGSFMDKEDLTPRVMKIALIFTDEAESDLGRIWVLFPLSHSKGLMEDPEIHQYVNAVATVVAERTSHYDMVFKVGVTEDSAVYGYGFPGGYILISKGLLQFMENEAELACVLSHEMAHAALAHGVHELSRPERKIHRRAAAAFEELELELERNASDAAKHRELEEEILHSGLQLMGGRALENELEADRYGIRCAARSGYDPNAMIALLMRIQRSGVEEETFRHHPPIAERVAALKEAIHQHHLDQSGSGKHTERFKSRVLDKIRSN